MYTHPARPGASRYSAPAYGRFHARGVATNIKQHAAAGGCDTRSQFIAEIAREGASAICSTTGALEIKEVVCL